MIKKGDWILTGGLLLLALIIFLVFALPGDGQKTVVIRQNGEIIYKGDISKDEVIEIGGEYANTVVIEDGEVYVLEASCPGRECVHMGRISSGGGIIACVPNALSITVEDSSGSGVDAVAE